MTDRNHAGPYRAICETCGHEIGAYESRWYGDTGAVHAWNPACHTPANQHKYPHYYTDG